MKRLNGKSVVGRIVKSLAAVVVMSVASLAHAGECGYWEESGYWQPASAGIVGETKNYNNTWITTQTWVELDCISVSNDSDEVTEPDCDELEASGQLSARLQAKRYSVAQAQSQCKKRLPAN
jgi:hypothetical protein